MKYIINFEEFSLSGVDVFFFCDLNNEIDKYYDNAGILSSNLIVIVLSLF